MIGFRVLQALGAAMLHTNSVALVVHSAPTDRMRAALGVQAAAQAVGLALGPTLGGLLVVALGWRWVYWINIPVGVLAVLARFFPLPRTRPRGQVRSRDLPGTLLLAAASTSLLLGVCRISGLTAAPLGGDRVARPRGADLGRVRAPAA